MGDAIVQDMEYEKLPPRCDRMESAEKQRERRVRRKRDGLCTDCGRTAFPGMPRCAGCLYKRRNSQTAYRVKNRELLNAKEKERRRDWERDGRCIRCAAPLRDGETKYCMACKSFGHEVLT